MSVKSFFKRLIPATYHKLDEHEWMLLTALRESQSALTEHLERMESEIQQKYNEQKKENEALKKCLEDVLEFETDFSAGVYRRIRELRTLIDEQVSELASKEDIMPLATLASVAELSQKEEKAELNVTEKIASLSALEKETARKLLSLATSEEVSRLATADAVSKLATAASVAELSEKEEKAHLSVLETAAKFATSEQLTAHENWAKDSLSKLATAEAVSRLASKEDIVPLATAAQVSKLATAEAVSKLAAADELESLSSLAKETAQKLNLLSAADTINRLASSEEFEQIPSVAKAIKESVKNSGETVWASIFHDAIQECAWLKNRKFFPGRWAAGYPALYAIYRVLDNFRPKKILELGLGQSTRVIGQYAAYFKDVSHTVVESNPEWIDFFKNDFELSEKTQIKNLEYKMIPFNGKNVRQFDKFNSTFKKEKFDFIFIDAPFGGDMTDFSRIDVARLLPDCLEKNFVIMLDDYDRIAEQNTCAEMEQILIKNKIDFKRGVYSGQKKTVLICSKNLSFLASM